MREGLKYNIRYDKIKYSNSLHFTQNIEFGKYIVLMNSVRPECEEELHFSSTLTFVILIGWSWRHQVMPTFPTLLSRRNTESIISALKFNTPLHINNKVGFSITRRWLGYCISCIVYVLVILNAAKQLANTFQREYGILAEGCPLVLSLIIIRKCTFLDERAQRVIISSYEKITKKMFVRVWMIAIATKRLELFERD